jgi:DNA-binding response OmpR family regulator
MRVLVIEDERKIAQLIKRGLTQESFAVDICQTGDEALEIMETESYDAIILDRMLPGNYEGIELCKTLRARNVMLPILLLTAKDTTRDKIDGLNSGADDYLVKPFDFDELVARIRALTRRPTQAHAVILRYDELELHTATRRAYRASMPITLTAKEFALLEYFMRHPGQVLSKQAIIQNVWNYDAIVVSNNVEVYIRMLRSKIDRAFAYPLIHTAKGMGYVLEARHP